MPLQFIIDALRIAGANPFFRSIGEDIVLSESRLDEQASALEDVVFVGYPNGIYDTSSLTPVARRGITATPVALDGQGKPAFLIDAAVFEGSSGSPVFLYGHPPLREGGPVALGASNRLLFAGVLASVHTRVRVGSVVELPTALASISTELLGLGIVFKPWTIGACIDPLLEKAGLTRATRQGPGENTLSAADAQLGGGPSTDPAFGLG